MRTQGRGDPFLALDLVLGLGQLCSQLLEVRILSLPGKFPKAGTTKAAHPPEVSDRQS